MGMQGLANITETMPCFEPPMMDEGLKEMRRFAPVAYRATMPWIGWSSTMSASNTYRIHGEDSLSIGRVTPWIEAKLIIETSIELSRASCVQQSSPGDAAAGDAFEAVLARFHANLNARTALENAESQAASETAAKSAARTPMLAIREALAAEDYYGARALAKQAHRDHPEDPELAVAAQVLAPPRVLRNDLPPDPTIRINMDWMEHEAHNYSGQWVAVKDGQVVASASTVRALKEQVPDLKGHFVVKVA